MELWTSIRTIVRRWYVVIPCLLAVAVVAVQLAGGVKPQYKAEGTVVFLRPLETEDAATAPGNPWQTVDYSLNQFALLMGQAADSPAFQERVSRAGGSTAFSVTTSATQAQGAPTNQTPTLTLSVVADTPESAMASYAILGDALDQEVRDRQRSVGAEEDTWIKAVDLTVPPGAQELVGSRLTVMIAVVIVGSLLTLGLVFLVDGFLAGRRREEGAAVVLVTDNPAGRRTERGTSELADPHHDEPERRDRNRRDRDRDRDQPLRDEGDPGQVVGDVDADVHDLTLDDLIEDWPDDHATGPWRPAISGRRQDRDDPDGVGDVVGL